MLRRPARILLIALASCTLFGLASPTAAQDADRPSIPELANQICDAMMVYDATGIRTATEAFELVLLNYLEIDQAEDPNYRSAIREFWNANHEEMVCTSDVRGFESPQHLLKRAIELRSASSFYFDYFLQDRSLNVNAIEYRNGHPETLVDYIDLILANAEFESRYDTAKLRRLRTFLIDHMNGQRAADLLAAE